LASNVIGWIEIDEAACDIAATLGTVPLPFRTRTSNRSHRMTTDPVSPMELAGPEFGGTEFVEADVRQLQADLEAEFTRLLHRLRAK
jgi:hypothetical protein